MLPQMVTVKSVFAFQRYGKHQKKLNKHTIRIKNMVVTILMIETQGDVPRPLGTERFGDVALFVTNLNQIAHFLPRPQTVLVILMAKNTNTIEPSPCVFILEMHLVLTEVK